MGRSAIRIKYALLAAAILVVSAGTSLSAKNELSAAPSVEDQQGMLRRTIRHDDVEREYFVHLPSDVVAGDTRIPVVVAIHGYTSTATGFQAAHGLNRHADEHGYIVVYPQGSHFLADDERGSPFRVTSWNELAANLPQTSAGPHCTADSVQYPCPPECGECSRCAWSSCYDDVGFIEKILDEIQLEFRADSRRTYLLGVSSGAMMTLRLGCNLSNRFAAIVPIIGQLAPGYACGPDVDLPLLHLFGGLDETVRFDGRPGTADGFIYTTAEDTAAIWATALACKSGPGNWQTVLSDSAGLRCTAYSDCHVDGHEVVSCLDPDGYHEWPEQYVRDTSATCVTAEQYDSIPGQAHCDPAIGEYGHLGMDIVWAFMKRYRLEH